MYKRYSAGEKGASHLPIHTFLMMETQHTPSVVSASRPLNYYQWGSNCEAWSFVNNKELDVKLEKMPPATEEVLHYHNTSQQFFYLFHGRAVFEIDDVILLLRAGQGIHIEAGRRHRIMNKEEETVLQFLVCSQPSTEGDRNNIA